MEKKWEGQSQCSFEEQERHLKQAFDLFDQMVRLQ